MGPIVKRQGIRGTKNDGRKKDEEREVLQGMALLLMIEGQWIGEVEFERMTSAELRTETVVMRSRAACFSAWAWEENPTSSPGVPEGAAMSSETRAGRKGSL